MKSERIFTCTIHWIFSLFIESFFLSLLFEINQLSKVERGGIDWFSSLRFTVDRNIMRTYLKERCRRRIIFSFLRLKFILHFQRSK